MISYARGVDLWAHGFLAVRDLVSLRPTLGVEVMGDAEQLVRVVEGRRRRQCVRSVFSVPPSMDAQA